MDMACYRLLPERVLVIRTITARAVCITAVRTSCVWIMVSVRIQEDVIVMQVLLAIAASIGVIPYRTVAETVFAISSVSASVMHVTAALSASTCVRETGLVWTNCVDVMIVTPGSCAKRNVAGMESVPTGAVSVMRIGEGHIVNERDVRGSPTALATGCVTVRFRSATVTRDGLGWTAAVLTALGSRTVTYAACVSRTLREPSA